MTSATPRRPLLARLLLSVLLDREDRRTVWSELDDLFEHHRATSGGRRAAREYRRQVMQYPVRLLWDRLRRFVPPPRSAPGLHQTAHSRDSFMASLRHDLRHAGRSLRRSPALTATIVATIGLGIGGTATVFSAIHAVLLSPLPYSDAEQLHRIYHEYPPFQYPLSVADYLAIHEQQTRFTDVAAYFSRRRTFTRNGDAQIVEARHVTAGYFGLLGITPQLGRLFTPTDDTPGAEPTVIVSHRFWRDQLGGEASGVGGTIELDRQPYTVIGVLPPRVGPLEERFDVFPAARFEPPSRKGPFFLTILGRLSPTTDVGVAAEELRAIEERIFPIWEASFSNRSSTYGVMPLREFVVGDVQTRLAVLFGAVAFVLLIASTNAANLLLARAARRRPELAIRAALGASRGRLVQHLLIESTLMAAAGAALGIAILAGAVTVLKSADPSVLPRATEVTISLPVLLFALVMAAGSTLLFGVVPSLQACRFGVAAAVRTGGWTGAAARSAHQLRRILVASQFAVAVPLLAGAGLLLASFGRLQRVDPGFRAQNVLTARIALPAGAYPDTAAAGAFWREMRSRLEAVPGVIAVGESTGQPLRTAGMSNNINLEDKPTPPDQVEPTIDWPIVTPGYFEALQIPLIRGRLFDDRDRVDAGVVALVDQAWAQRFYPGEEVLGRRFHQGGCTTPDCPLITVIGVVGTALYNGLNAVPEGTIYTPLAMWPSSTRYVYVRTADQPAAFAPVLRSIIRQIDPALAVENVVTMEEVVGESLASPRNFLALVGTFAAMALTLAAIGIYGVMAYFVQQRSREMAIRIALGGGPTRVRRFVVRQGVALAASGLVVGVAGALCLTRFMSAMLFEIDAADPTTFIAVTAGILVTTVAACAFPAYRASRLDPAVTLRET